MRPLKYTLLIGTLLFGEEVHSDSWKHSFDTVSSMLWADMSGINHSYALSDEQITFVAQTYSIISLEKCYAMLNYSSTELGVIETARRLKWVNSKLKILMYYNVIEDFSDCYAAGQIFNSTPSWWMKDDDGNYYGDTSRHYHDIMQHPVKEYWINSILNPITWPNATGLIDGVFADRASGISLPNMSAYHLRQLINNEHVMYNMTRNSLYSVVGSDAHLIGNALVQYPDNPPDHGMDNIPYLDGAVFEHFLSFEMLDPKNGSLIPSLFDQAINLINNVSVYQGKTVLVKAWPGPCTLPIETLGPQYPNMSAPITYAGRAQAATNGLEPSLAGFLLVAQSNVWLSYSTWYTAADGYYLCPYNECSTPQNWYPEFSNKLGIPINNVTRLSKEIGSGWVYTRNFTNAYVYFDAVEWTNAKILWSE